MKNITLLILLIFLSCQTKVKQQSKINEIFEKEFEHSLISRGNNFPDFNYQKDSMDLFLIALHEQIPLSEFRKKTGLTEKKIKEIENLLESKNWLHFDDKNPKPSIFIATEEDGKILFDHSKPIAIEIVAEIERELSEIKKQFNQTEISKTQDFSKWSFLILSNVLLDSWQIDNVESEFLKKEKRPERHGKNYYYSIMENVEKNREVFGIYGNQYEEKNGKSISIYGNNRIGVTNISSENYISKLDNQILTKIAENFKPKLINILNQKSEYIGEIYKKTGYENEITFEEFFIWWYHFIYTQATDIMNKKKMLTIPKSGNFEYVISE